MVINYFAVLVAAIVCYVVGWAWYSPILFVKPWLRSRGKDADKIMADMKGMKMPMDKMVIEFITTLVFVAVVAQFVAWMGVWTWLGAVHLSIWLWLGFFAAPLVGAVIWEEGTWLHYAITAGRWLVSLIIVTLILGLWH